MGTTISWTGVSPRFMMRLTGTNLQILKPRMASLSYPLVFFGGPAILLTRITSETRSVGDLEEFLPLEV